MIFTLAEVWFTAEYSLSDAKFWLKSKGLDTYIDVQEIVGSHFIFQYLKTEMYKTVSFLLESETIRIVLREEHGMSDIPVQAKYHEIDLELKSVLL